MTVPETGLSAETRKLRKINAVLMARVERDTDAHGGNAYSLFQTAIMLESLVSERTAELTRVTQRLLHEISERRDAEAALLQAKARAEQANLDKTRFLAAASHDLRQPLNAARLFLDALHDEVGSGRPRELLLHLGAALETLNELLATLLDISRLDAGAWPVDPVSFPIAPLLARLGDEYRPQAEARGLELRVVQCSAILHTDRQLFERVLRNFISNAIRYTVAGRILVGCRRGASLLRVEVWDTGIGIPADKLTHVFEEFGQVGNSPRRDDKGVGLGLAIVDRIARLLGLPVDIASTVGRGSRFGVAAPYGRLRGDDAPERPMRSDLAGHVIGVVNESGRASDEVLALLGEWECCSVAASSSAALLAAMDRDGLRPDLILVEESASGDAAGAGIVADLRASCGKVPAILLTADRSPACKARARSDGYALLARPASAAKLRSVLSYFLCQLTPDQPHADRA